MRISKAVKLVALAVCAVLVVAWMSTSGESDEQSQLVATIPDAGALDAGNEVRASGVLVGEVADVELVDGQARVTLDLQDGVLPVHEDATLTVRPANLLGEAYLDLDKGSPEVAFLRSNEIPTNQVSSATTLQDVLQTFEAPVAASLAAVVTALGEGMHDNGGEVAATLEALGPAMADLEQLGKLLSQQNDVLAELVATTDPVARSLAHDEGRTLDQLVAATEQTLGALARQESALAQTLVELPNTLTAARRTLSELTGVADEAVPTLRELRPLTGDLGEVVGELKAFADAADPALASLTPVLARADELLDQAAPLVKGLRKAGPDLRTATGALKPVGLELLDENLYGVMEFVRKWALSTNGRDGLSHYFRGVIYVTPETLDSLLQSFLPGGFSAPSNTGGSKLPLPDLGGTLDGLIGGAVDGVVSGDLTGTDGALGLTEKQESALLGQLLGGGN